MYKPKEDYIQHNVETLHTSLKGAINELEAAAWLISEGYEVFRNLAPVGKADLIIWKKGIIPILVDVKSAGSYSKVQNVKTVSKINGEWQFVEKSKEYKKVG